MNKWLICATVIIACIGLAFWISAFNLWKCHRPRKTIFTGYAITQEVRTLQQRVSDCAGGYHAD